VSKGIFALVQSTERSGTSKFFTGSHTTLKKTSLILNTYLVNPIMHL
jgi:hypothetical protein